MDNLNLTKYILFVFSKNDNPKEFAEQIADELCVISDSPNLNFYFGPESSVFTISTLESYEDVKDYVDMILGIDGIMYVLLPYTSDKMSYGLPNSVSEHLFNDGISDYMSGNSKVSINDDFEVRRIIQDQIKESFLLNLEFLEDEDNEILELKSKKSKLTFDELFEKLADSGIESLSKEELELLNKYSK